MRNKQYMSAATTTACITIPVKIHEEMKAIQQAMIEAECDKTITLSRVYRKAAELYARARTQQKLVEEWGRNGVSRTGKLTKSA